jgi:MFS family permease
MPDAAPRAKTWWLSLNFALTIFVSAFLLFQVQPLISKFILPWFGGGPAVWTTCMLFFQTLLFAGYLYAHLSVKLLSPARQGLVHVVLLVAALVLTLPSIAPSVSWKPDNSEYPEWKIMALLAVCVGLPYLMLSSTGPLLQAWFARTFPGRSPYRLYALSNVGSLLALVSYPFVFEPALDNFQQSYGWSWGFALFVVLCGYAAIHTWNQGRTAAVTAARAGVPASAKATDEPAPAWYQPIVWIALPAFASMMLLATTNHVCQDVAVIPFLWVVPLSLYLLSFIISFDHERWYIRPFFAIAGLVFLYLATATPNFKLDMGGKITLISFAKQTIERWYNGPPLDVESAEPPAADEVTDEEYKPKYRFEPEVDYRGELVIHFAALFCVCMICHGELVRVRPAPRYLTLFYLMISAGGALGGIFVSLIAPVIFDSFLEWNIGVLGGVVLTALVFLLSTGVFQHFDEVTGSTKRKERGWSLLRWSAMLLLFAVPWLVLSGIAWSDMMKMLRPDEENIIAQTRNFYGALRVQEEFPDDPVNRRRLLYNGRIIHGMQFMDEDQRVPTTYYSSDSGIGRAVGFFRSQPNMRIGVVGLGTGTMAAFAIEKGHYTRFYEINPEVEEFSNEYFTYRKNSPGPVDVMMGDARLTLEREAETDPQRFDILVLDAFSGDAIPTHLITREAFEIYLKHVDISNGIIAVHISNRYLDLVPVVRGLCEHFKLKSIRINASGEGVGAYNSEWICVTNNQAFLDTHSADDEYETDWFPQFMFFAGEEEPHAAFETIRNWPRAILWTDAHSNLFEILMRKEED